MTPHPKGNLVDEDRIIARLAPYRKAAAAFLLPPVLTAFTAVADGSAITTAEGLLIAASALAVGGTVYRLPNAALPAADPTPHAPDAT